MFELRIPDSMKAIPGRMHILPDEPITPFRGPVRCCKGCDTYLPMERFSSWEQNGTRRYRWQCKDCVMAKWRANHVPKVRKPSVAASLRDKATALRAKGLSFGAVARRLGVSRTTVFRAVSGVGA